MYAIRLNGKIIADSMSTDERTAIVSGVLEQQVNCIDSFAFEVEKEHMSYNALTFGKIVELYDNDAVIFRGYIANIELDTYSRKKCICNGMLGLLNDSVFRTVTSTKTPRDWLDFAITWHNNQQNEGGVSGRTFTRGVVQINTPNITVEQTEYTTVYDFLASTLIEGIGGYLVYRYEGGVNYIDILSSIGDEESTQPVAPELNLLEYKSTLINEEFCTRYIPLGASQEDGTRLTIASVNSGSDHLDDSTLMDAYGSITAFEIYDNINDAATLKSMGQKRFAELKKLRNKITINALDVSYTDSAYKGQPLKFMSVVTIADWYHGVNASAVIMAKSTDIIDATNNKVTFELTI